jgi:RHS repeat-associated protein
LADDPPADAWRQKLSYVYDAFGRRIEKKYDDLTVLKYVYDGAHCIAEYDAYSHVRRKYIYGPAVDEPICLIESTSTYAGTYYYHCDGLGSVTALTNASGTTVAVYEYDVYGRVGASVPAHPNRILFTGREYDQETGLYYYRARYYNPQIGRFLQTDPKGYGAGMNLYRYCANNPTNFADPMGLDFWYNFLGPGSDGFVEGKLTFAKIVDGCSVVQTMSFDSIDEWCKWADEHPYFFDEASSEWVPEIEKRTGYKLAGGDMALLWELQALLYLGIDTVSDIEAAGGVRIVRSNQGINQYDPGSNIVYWNYTITNIDPGKYQYKAWYYQDPLIGLVHELAHARQDVVLHLPMGDPDPAINDLIRREREVGAVKTENMARAVFYSRGVPGSENLWPRPGYEAYHWDIGWNCADAWRQYNFWRVQY